MTGSDHGHMMPMPMAYQNTGSMYGMPTMMNPMTGMNMNMNMNMFGGGGGNGSPAGSQIAAVPPSVPPLSLGQRPASTFSMATSVGLFGPSNSTNPTEEELFNALRNHLSTQDLMTVTKK
jgi:chitin synthase